MQVGFGVSVLAHGIVNSQVDGIGNYTRELMARFAATPTMSVRPYMYGAPLEGANISSLVSGGRFGRQALLAIGTGLPFPKMQEVFAGHVDLVHATDHLIPKLRDIPLVASLMDAIPLAHPEWISYRLKRTKNYLWMRSARWADHIITISEFSRGEIARWFRLPEQRISVTPLGVDARWFLPSTAEDNERVRRAHALPERYFICVGTLQPRKNLERLIAAHQALPPALRREFPLLIVGRAGWDCQDVVDAIERDKPSALRWLKYVADEDLQPLLSQARALLFPSLYEGFGLPVLEAFAAGVPVIASDATSIPEVAADAALLVDPLCIGAWTEAMQFVVQDDRAVGIMRERGLERARQFTWEQTAALTHDVYRRVLSGTI